MIGAVFAVAAMVALTIATGGAILIIAAVVLTAAAGTVGYAAYEGITHIKHDCDLPLKFEWFLFHSTVNINGSKAVLQKSCMKCSNGGIIQPFIDNGLANEVATKISSNNMKEFYANEKAQAEMALINVLATINPWSFKEGPDAIGLGIMFGFSVYEYNDSDGDGKDGQQTKQSAYSDTYITKKEKEIEADNFDIHAVTRDNIVGGTATAGEETDKGIGELTEQNKGIIREVMDQGGSYKTAEALTGLGETSGKIIYLKGVRTVTSSVGLAIAAFLINYKIGAAAHEEEKELFYKSQDKMQDLSKMDGLNNIKVIANKP